MTVIFFQRLRITRQCASPSPPRPPTLSPVFFQGGQAHPPLNFFAYLRRFPPDDLAFPRLWRGSPESSRNEQVTADEPLLGVQVAGWPAFVVDVILRRHLPSYLKVMSPAQAREVEQFHAAVQVAAAYWQKRSTSAASSAEAAAAEVTSRSTSEDLSTTQAAALLGVSERRVCQLAADWQHDGLARKVGRAWLVDREAVAVYARKAA